MVGTREGDDGVARGDSAGWRGFYRDVFCEGCGEGIGLDMARIGIVGVGAIGGVTAALLQQAGHELLLCTRRPMAELSVETPDGLVRVGRTFVTNPAEASAVDWVIASMKA